MRPPVRPFARRLPRPPVRFGSAVLASLAVALAGAAPGASAAPLHVPTERPIQSVQPPPVQQVVRDVPFHVPSTLASGPLAHDVANALTVGNVTAPHLSDGIAPIDRLPVPGSTPPPSPPPPTPVITPQTTLLMEAPFEGLQAAWQQATDLPYVINDAQGNPAVLGVDQSRVPTSSVNIEVPVGLLDATLSPIFPQPVAPDSQAFAPVLGGDHGIVTVQVDDCLPDGQGQAAGLGQFIDPTSGLPVGCTDPLGNVGSRYILGGGQTNLYTTTSPAGQQIVRTFGQPCGDAQAPSQGGLAQSCVLIPVQLPAVANALRLDVDVHVVQDPGDTYPFCDPNTLQGTFCPVSGKRPEMAPAGEVILYDNGSRAETSGSVALETVVVLPAALAQLKVLPYTIVYMPPGNASTASFTTTTTFGTTMTAGDSTALDNTTKSSKSLDIATTVSGSFASSGLSLGADLSTDSHWDHTTSSDVGSVQTDTSTSTSSATTVRAFGPLSNSTLVPGAKGAYGSEPFWSDEIVLLQHPQLGVWNLKGATKVQLLGARGTTAAPDFAEPSLKDLDDCQRSAAPYAGGYPLPDGDVLNAQECLALATLDPFYTFGQSFDPNAAGRGVPAGGTDYGMDPAGTNQDEHQGFDHVIQWSQTNAQASARSYDASVTDVFGTSYSAGLTLGAKGTGDSDIGFKTSVTLKAGSSNSSSVDMKISYQNSTATHVQSATAIDGSFDDHNTGLGYRPHVEVFQDLVFGSYMFQDQAAPGNCPRIDCAIGVIPLVNPPSNTPPRIVLNTHVPGNPALSETGTTRLGTTTTTTTTPAAPIRQPGRPPVALR